MLDSCGSEDDTIQAVQFLDRQRKGRAVGSYLYSLLKVRTDFCKTLMEMSFPGNAHQQVGRLVLVE